MPPKILSGLRISLFPHPGHHKRQFSCSFSRKVQVQKFFSIQTRQKSLAEWLKLQIVGSQRKVMQTSCSLHSPVQQTNGHVRSTNKNTPQMQRTRMNPRVGTSDNPIPKPLYPGLPGRLLCTLAGCLALIVSALPAKAATLTYNFNNGTLQGWHNRVWDLSANNGSGGWVELEPNATAVPFTINDGALQPPSGDNGLFGNNGSQVDPVGGHNDNHMNTIWLRSPSSPWMVPAT